ncbi:MAG: hypothetical protein IPF99_33345 [Deltaproteobacteria bacterium]|nr:hypothetical protein [Deltaproteobacteria bacterium]
MNDTEQGLTQTYDQLKDPRCQDGRVVALRRLHEEMDRAVLAAYGWDDLVVPPYGTPGTDVERAAVARFEDEVINRLFALNAQRAAEEKAASAAGAVAGGKTKGAKRGKKAGAAGGDGSGQGVRGSGEVHDLAILFTAQRIIYLGLPVINADPCEHCDQPHEEQHRNTLSPPTALQSNASMCSYQIPLRLATEPTKGTSECSGEFDISGLTAAF